MIETVKMKGWRVSRWRTGMWAAIGIVLVAPLLAMQFTEQVAWTLSDFGLAALLLGGAGLIFEVAARSSLKFQYKAAIGGLLLATVLIVWGEGAVGIFS